MGYKAIVLDVDGTLMVHGEATVRPAVARAVQQAQKQGVKVVIATGRTHFAIAPHILGGIRPDYAVCANGAQVLDKKGRVLHANPMTNEEMYALVDFFEDYNYPLAFCFSDNYHVYVEYQQMKEIFYASTGHAEYVVDGEDQDRHLESMPVGAFAVLPPEQLQAFEQQYGYLGLQFVTFKTGYYDVIPQGVNKAEGLKKLLEHTGWKPEEVVFVGDNDNDAEMLAMGGLSYAMGNGSAKAKAAAAQLAPTAEEEGARWVVEQLFL